MRQRFLDSVSDMHTVGKLGPTAISIFWSSGGDTSLLDQAALIIELEQFLERKVDVPSDGCVNPAARESIYRDAVAL